MTKKVMPKKTPAKGKSATKSGEKNKSSAKKKAKASNQGPSKTWRQRLWSVGWKLAAVGVAVLVVSGIYLNSLVKHRFDGQLFDLPTVVYARILYLNPGDKITIQAMRNELNALNYRKVRRPRHPGEYSSSSTKIELYRRPFDFSDGPEAARHVMLYFNNQGLQRIQSLDEDANLGYLRLDPKMLGMLEKNTDQQRLFLRREQFPEVLVDALLTTEDRNFYKHEGVSPVAILRAMAANIRAGHTVQGGSTLTQQLAKNLFLSRDRTLWRKLREAYIALILDYRYSKDRILQAYLNEVYLGQSGSEAIHGFALASRYYFGHPINELRIDQLAMLVGMVKGPSYYNPVRFPERSLQRRDLVLKLMLEHDILTVKQYKQAVNRPLDVQASPHIAQRQPAYFQQLKLELREKLGRQFQAEAGIHVFTSLDPVAQLDLEKAVARTVPRLGKVKSKYLEAAGVVVDRHSGEIRAMVGGKRVGYDGFNRALNASRQIGSLAKPAVYLTALQQPDKYTLASTLHDQPISLKDHKGVVWTPRNFDRKYRGDVPLYEALAHSINVPTVELGMALGIDSVVKTFEKLGVDKKEIIAVPSMFLGSFSLTPVQVAQMYQTLTNSGKKARLSALRSVVDLEGNLLYESIPSVTQAVNTQAAWLTTYAMKKGVLEGTGRYLNQLFPKAGLAGKTGTSNDTRDSWFVGIDGREVTTIWVGRDDNKPIYLTGASGALRVYAQYLKYRVPEKLELPWPKGMTTLGYDHQANGDLSLDCSADFKLPVWDANGKIKKACRQGVTGWLKGLLDW